MKRFGIIITLFISLLAHIAWADEDEEGKGEHEEESSEVMLSEEALREKGITFEAAGPRKIARVLKVYGRIGVNQNRLARIHPRFPGLLREVRKGLGDVVEKGETLAVIESNQSLQPYQVVSFLPGTVLFRRATVGEYVADSDTIFVIGDLTTLWVDLFIFPRDFASVKEGLEVRIRPPHSDEQLVSTITFLSRVADERTQARVARAVVDGNKHSLYPDQYVEADIVTEMVPVPLAVTSSAVQLIGDKSVVFVKAGRGYEPQEIVTGRSDGEATEILSGLTPGVEYAVGKTFLLKAELGKESVEDDD
jgi:cobalt-zinc-cadmium efflux system membrane fusion protein